jgi:hypothetical protein
MHYYLRPPPLQKRCCRDSMFLFKHLTTVIKAKDLTETKVATVTHHLAVIGQLDVTRGTDSVAVPVETFQGSTTLGGSKHWADLI